MEIQGGGSFIEDLKNAAAQAAVFLVPFIPELRRQTHNKSSAADISRIPTPWPLNHNGLSYWVGLH